MSDIVLPAHLSYSQVTTMLHCGEQWRLSRLMHLAEAPAWALVGGSAVHKASETYDLLLGNDPFSPRDLFRDAFEECIADELVKAPEGFEDTSTWRASGRASKQWPNKEDERWWREHGPEFVANWITWRQYSPLDIWRDDENNLAVELEATVEIAGLPVKAFIDRAMTGP